jgi:hypothetical protein
MLRSRPYATSRLDERGGLEAAARQNTFAEQLADGAGCGEAKCLDGPYEVGGIVDCCDLPRRRRRGR